MRSKTSPFAKLWGNAWVIVVDQFGDAVQHRSERCGKEANDWSSSSELLLSLGQDIGVSVDHGQPQGPMGMTCQIAC